MNRCFYEHAVLKAFPPGVGRSVADARLQLVVAFFGAFGIAIALMKDVPDTDGDEAGGIRTLSRRLGRGAIFRVASNLLSVTLCSAAVGLGVAAVAAFNANGLRRAATRLGLAGVLGFLARDATSRASDVHPDEGDEVAAFYMHLWKCFFVCYALLPFAR